MVLGTMIGIASGFLGGRIGGLLYRLTEWFLVIPFVPLALVLATLLGGSLYTIAFVIGVTSWPGTALLIRAQTLSIKNRPYMERARVLGRRQLAPDAEAHPAERDADGVRQHHAHGGRSHPGGDDAVVPRLR